jgi:protein involved in polysaccharide export with SLBB domain
MSITCLRFAGGALVALCAAAGSVTPLLAQNEFLVDQTKLRLSVYQFDQSTGQYARWDALSGDIMVEPGNLLDVPVIGVLSVDGRTPRELAADIADRLQKKLGLREAPDTRIEISAYPPVYVVGMVEQPGEYNFRPGMTVLQALALGGGMQRSDKTGSATSERVKLLAELKGFEEQLDRTLLRVARLKAELAEADTITVDPSSDSEGLQMEQAVLEASKTARDRQIASLTDLQALYQQEIDVLQIRIGDLDKSIASTEKELAGVEQLVASGMATVARRSELERLLASQRSDRLDQVTSVMRAKQFMTEAERNADGIEDERRSALTQQWLTDNALIKELTLKAQTTRALLSTLDAQLLASGGGNAVDSEPTLTFAIVRKTGDAAVASTATEDAVLLPGDVVKVSLAEARGAAAPAIPDGQQEAVNSHVP